MKKILFVLVALLFLLGLVAVPHATTFAAADATCSSDPSSGPVGTTFVITCWGYTPGAHVYAYLVEPAGVATTVFGNGSIKVAEDGSISYVQDSYYIDPFPPFSHRSLATGTWGFVAEEIGLADSVIHRGETTFSITGGTEGVSGALLSVSPSTLHKPVQAYDHVYIPPLAINGLAFSDPATLSGSGFAPNEMVSFWVEPPQGGCPSSTVHYKWNQTLVVSGVGMQTVDISQNVAIFDSYGSQSWGTVKASASGDASIQAFFTSLACEGEWHFVARGNASGWGADTVLTVIGNAVETNAWLTATPDSASALFGTIQFNGSGFGANEHVSCWLRTPRGQVLGYPHDEFLTYNIDPPPVGISLKNLAIRSDSAGNIAFDFVSGSQYVDIDFNLVLGGTSFPDHLTIKDPVQSEGALGVYAMTCRGDSSGATAIAEFTLTGGFVDP